MPKYDYDPDPETYSEDPVFEPNRSRRKDKFRKEREEQEKQEEQE